MVFENESNNAEIFFVWDVFRQSILFQPTGSVHEVEVYIVVGLITMKDKSVGGVAMGGHLHSCECRWGGQVLIYTATYITEPVGTMYLRPASISPACPSNMAAP